MTDTSPRRSAYSRLLDRAMRILGMRDHSEQEFRRKLTAPVMTKTGPEPVDATEEDINNVVSWCYENRYLDVDHRHRETGRSKYTNWGRLMASFSDLLGVMWLKTRSRRPGGVSEF